MLKKLKFVIYVIGLVFEILKNVSAQSVGINNPTPDPSSIMDMTATDRGLLIPRMTTAQRNAIVAPANGLLIINTTTACTEMYWGGVWNSMGCACVGAPAAPVANAGTSLLATQFTANWIAASGATAYYLDIATDVLFTSFVTGFNNLNVSNVTGYNVTGLTCNTTYYYRVRAVNNCGTGVSSSTITVTTAAATGTTAIATTGVQQTQFTANWGALAGATTYYLDVATDAAFLTFVTGYNNLNMGLVTSSTVSGLTCGTTYYYRVRAATSCGASSNSNTISQVTTSSPAAPVATSASGLLQAQFTANWGAVAGATTYYLDVATDAAFTTFVPGYSGISTGVVTSYNVSGLACNTLYYYRLRSTSGCGTSANSNTITVTSCACSPTSSAATNVLSGSFSANWAAAGGATTYYIDVATDAAFTSILPAYTNLNTGLVTSYSIIGLTCNTAYYYRVRTGSTCAVTGNSGTISLTTANASATTASAASAIAQTQLTANWVSSSGATSYQLDVASDAGFTVMVVNNLNVGLVTSYIVAALTCNTPYYYRVRAIYTCGTSINSNTITATTCVCTPTATAATAIVANGFAANWNIVPSASTYYLDVATDVAFASILPAYNNLNVGNVLTYPVTGLACNTAYYYRLRASSACGTSVSGNTINLTTLATSAPVATTASGNTSTSFSANWSAFAGATSYILDVATDAGFTAWVVNGLNVGLVTTHSVTGLSCGTTTYYYRIRVVNACGTSINSNTITTAITGIFSVPITLTNGQATATGANFQQKIIVNSSTYSAYETAGLQNVKFTTGVGATGSVLQAWIESGITTASVNTVYWINLGASTVPASGTLTIYMNFMPTNVMSSAGPTGCAPTTFTSTYGDLDNGTLVFGIYNNFAGNSVNGAIFTSVIPGAGTTITQNNGVTIATNATTTYGGLIYTAGYSSAPAQVFDGNVTAVSGVAAGLALQTASAGNSTCITLNFWSGSVATGSMSAGLGNTNNPNHLIAVGIEGGAWMTAATQVWYHNYASFAGTQNAYALPATIYPSIGIYNSSTNSSITYQWIRTHLYAPSGVMPTTGLGAVTCN